MRQDTPLRQLLSLRAMQSRTPVTGGFELTPHCNLSCKMCYIHSRSGQELSAAQWLDMGRQAVEAGTLFLLLTGGEPFLRRDFREIYLGLTRMGLSVSINTNGTLIDDEAVRWLSASPPAQVNLSLYGVTPEAYGALCGEPDACTRAKRAVDRLLEAGVALTLNATLTPLNIGQLDGIADFAAQRGLHVRPTTYLFPPVRREGLGCVPPERFSAQEAGRYSALSQWKTSDRETLRAFAAAQPDAECFCPTDDCLCTDDSRCLAGRSQFWISWDGRMMPCGMLDEPQTYPFADGFLPAWRELTRRLEAVLLPAVCDGCALRGACPACAAIHRCETGSTSRRAHYLCDMTQSYLRTLQTLCADEETPEVDFVTSDEARK